MNDIIFTSAETKSVFKANNLEWGLNFNHSANKFALIRGNGDYFQDLGNESFAGNLRFTFKVGSEESRAFFLSIQETGAATVTQPDEDEILNIQPFAVSKKLKFVKDVKRVIYTVSYFTTRLPDEVESENTLFNQLEVKDDAAVLSAAENFENSQVIETVADSVRQQNNFKTAIESATRSLGVVGSELESSIDSIVTDPIKALIAFNELIATPAILFDRISNKIDGYQNLISDLLNVSTLAGQSINQRTNDLLFAEAASSIVLSKMAAATSEASYLTKSSVLETVTKLNELYIENRDTLDDFQEMGIFEQSGTTKQSISIYINDVAAFLFTLVFNLKTEIVFEVDSPITIYDIAAEYYSDELKADELSIIEYIIDTNNLVNDEIIEIQSGREIRVYV